MWKLAHWAFEGSSLHVRFRPKYRMDMMMHWKEWYHPLSIICSDGISNWNWLTFPSHKLVTCPHSYCCYDHCIVEWKVFKPKENHTWYHLHWNHSRSVDTVSILDLILAIIFYFILLHFILVGFNDVAAHNSFLHFRYELWWLLPVRLAHIPAFAPN